MNPSGSTSVSQLPPATYVPTTYAELFESYFHYSVRILIREGIRPRDAEDVAMTILARLIERDILSMFDPTRTTIKEGKARTCSFTVFLTSFFLTYVRHYRTKQVQLARREQQMSGKNPLTESDWLDLKSPPTGDTSEALAESMAAEWQTVVIRTHLQEVDAPDAPVSLLAVYDAAAQVYKASGKVLRKDIAATLGISTDALRGRYAAMKEAIADLLPVLQPV